MYKTILTIAFAMCVSFANAQTTYTALGGNWNNAGSWDIGVPPTSGDGTDIVVIPVGVTITITGVVSFDGTINISGTLSLQSSGFFNIVPAILIMDASSTINILAGGQILSGGGGLGEIGNAISIGGLSTIYSPTLGSPNPMPGPQTIDITTGLVPIELLFFEAQAENQHVILIWATASEDNFDYFALERSIDGENFIEIAQIQGMGESFSQVDYDFVDNLPLQGRSYYRLRSVDFDGYTEIFDYVMVETEGLKSDFSVYPNPIENGNFSIKTNYYSGDKIELLIFNSMGGLERSYQLDSWMNNLNLEGLKPGSYLLKLVTTEDVIIKRVLVN